MISFRKYIGSFILFLFIVHYMTSFAMSYSLGGASASLNDSIGDTSLVRNLNILVLFSSILTSILIGWKGILLKKYFKIFLIFSILYIYTIIQSILNFSFGKISIILNYPLIIYIFLFLYDKFGSSYIVNLFLKIFSFILIFSLFLILFVPDYGISVGRHEGAWQGMFLHKNGFGFFLFLFNSIVLVKYYLSNNGRFLILLPLIFIFIINSFSSTALLLTILQIFLFTLYKFKLKKIFNTISKPLFFIFFTAFNFLFIISMSMLISSFVGKEGYSSRDLIWYAGFNLYKNNFLFGNGYNNDNLYLPVLESALGVSINSFHNGFLDILVFFGTVGFFIFFIQLYYILNIIRYNGFSYYVLMLPLLIYCFFESLLFGQNITYLFILFVLFSSIRLEIFPKKRCSRNEKSYYISI